MTNSYGTSGKISGAKEEIHPQAKRRKKEGGTDEDGESTGPRKAAGKGFETTWTEGEAERLVDSIEDKWWAGYEEIKQKRDDRKENYDKS